MKAHSVWSPAVCFVRCRDLVMSHCRMPRFAERTCFVTGVRGACLLQRDTENKTWGGQAHHTQHCCNSHLFPCHQPVETCLWTRRPPYLLHSPWDAAGVQHWFHGFLIRAALASC